MPPTQWVKLRQKSILLHMASTSVRMLAPVVVKPEAVSKKASASRGISPEKINGSAPKKESSSQEVPTMKNPSRTYIPRFLGHFRERGIPTASSSRMVRAKSGMVSSP